MKALTYALSIDEIKKANRLAGQHFFDFDTLRFFDSVVEPYVYQGPGGTFFLTSEQFHGSSGSAPRKWTVRQFTPDGRCKTAEGTRFNELNQYEAKVLAAKLAEGGVQ